MFHLRPVALAKQFIHEVESSYEVREEFFNKIPAEQLRGVDKALKQRTWRDYLTCKQRFTVGVKKPLPNTTSKLVVERDFSTGLIGVYVTSPMTVMTTR